MKKKIIMILISISIGVLFTISYLNKERFYAKEKYLIYAFQVGSFSDINNATNYINNINKGIIVNDNNSYKIYVGLYKNIDVVNKMLVYFEDNNISIYLKNIEVDKKFYNILDNYEKIIINTDNINLINKVNDSILNIYINGEEYEEIN